VHFLRHPKESAFEPATFSLLLVFVSQVFFGEQGAVDQLLRTERKAATFFSQVFFGKQGAVDQLLRTERKAATFFSQVFFGKQGAVDQLLRTERKAARRLPLYPN